MPLRAIMEKFGAASFGAIAAAVTGLTFPGAVQLAGALTLYEMELTCPIDGQKFRTSMVASYTSRGVRLDLKPLGTDVAPYPYPVCPGNGFVIYQSEFSDAELAAIRSIVAGDEFKAYRREHTDHAVVAHVKQRLGADDFDVASSFLLASWEAERDRPQLVEQYRALALEKFDAARERGQLDEDDWWTAAVMGAELTRLAGDFAAAEARLRDLPRGELAADGGKSTKNAMLAKVIDQIAQHASNRNAEPQELSDQPLEGTVGSGGR
jgi:hypothetical protein